MSFLGKKFRRTRYENVDELLKAGNSNEDVVRVLQGPSPVFCFTRINDTTFNFVLEMSGKHLTFDFTLGEEKEVERRDGETVKLIFTMPNENTLHQRIKTPNGKIIYFTREFYKKEAKMTITMEGTDMEAFIYFEVVE